MNNDPHPLAQRLARANSHHRTTERRAIVGLQACAGTINNFHRLVHPEEIRALTAWKVGEQLGPGASNG